MSDMPAVGEVYALLADGTTVEIRPVRAQDFDAIKAMHEAMSPANLYMRFFSMSRMAADREARRLTREPGPDHAALLALAGGEVVGTASYEVEKDPETGDIRDTAEIAFAVADSMHHRGIATLLLEHLVSFARAHQLRAFVAETLPENTAMLRTFTEAGLPVSTRRGDGVVMITIPLPPDDTDLDAYLDRVARRERRANIASLRPVFDPESVVVIGAGRRLGSVGHSVVDNILKGGFKGRLYAVNPNAAEISGVPSFPGMASLPEAPDLAVVAVPPSAVVDVAEACGQNGVRGLVVLTSGMDADSSAGLLATCRRHGMRLIGPNCFGIAVPGIGLDATFSATTPLAGTAGLVMQSGGLGFAMVDQLSRLGIGISSFASVGNKLDVSSNDLLMWWEQDGVTRLAVLYIESFGNPRKFARTARRVSVKMPVLTVHAGRSEAGQQAAASHTRAIATPLVTREALFEQAGIIATPGYGELIEATALLATQPVPAGRTIAIVSNVGGAGVLAADACTDLGLVVHHPSGQHRRTLHSLVPEGSAVNGPVDTTATISREEFRRVLEHLASDEDVHALIAIVLPTAPAGDIVAAITEAAVDKPLAAVVLNQPEAVRMLPGARADSVPSYAYPEAAVRALARGVMYGEWRSRPDHALPRFPDIEGAADEARELVRAFLARTPGGGWLSHAERHALLRAYGIPVAPITTAHSADDAVAALHALEGPVVLKGEVPGLVHKSDAGAVLLDLRTADEVRAGYEQLLQRFGDRLHGVGVQPMITSGIEVMIGVADDPMFGPLVVFGLGGVATEVLADHSARLAPLTADDADALIESIRSAPLLHGHRGTPAADVDALRDVLMRVSRLADDVPEISELDLNPVIARPDGAVAVDSRIRVIPQAPRDPYLRRLRLSLHSVIEKSLREGDSPVTMTEARPLSAAELNAIDAWWRAANYLSVGQIYLLDNPLLTEELKPEHVKPRLLGHWGTTPGLNLIYAHLNRVIRNWDLDVIYIAGPGHGGPGLVANTYLEGTYTERYPSITQDATGMQRLFRQFSFPGGIPSHVAPETPGSIHEGGELGYSLAHAYGAAFDNPDLIVACVVGDGESETGPLAGSWHSNKFLNPVTDGAVLPILHLNGYKIANPTVPARIPVEELTGLLTGYGYHVYVVEGDDPRLVHESMAAALDAIVAEIHDIQRRARTQGVTERPAWPALILKTPKGWTGPKIVDGKQVEGTWRSHQVPISAARANPEHLRQLEEWMRSYRPAELFDSSGRLVPELAQLAPRSWRRMSANPHANGGELLRDLDLPRFQDYAVHVPAPGAAEAENTRVLGGWIRDIISRNRETFRLFGPDETASNRLDDVFSVTGRAFEGEIVDGDNQLTHDGRVMEVLSEHLCQGWLEGYLLTGRHGLFNCYEAFIHIVDSMFNQHAKWLKTSRHIPWRRPVASLNYLLSSLVWRQDHNGFSHQDPGFIDHVVNKKAEVIRVYLPPDANTLLSVADHCLRSKQYVNVIVAGKQPQAQWLSMDDAIIHCTRGAGIWDWASTDGDGGGAPDVVLACCGDTPTLETLAAASLLRQHLPSLRVRVVNVVDLMRLQPSSEHPHGMSDAEFDALFTVDRPVIFAYHGYPWLIHRLTYRRRGHSNFHVRGYKEEGTTTTPFDMVMMNDLDRFHLVMDVIDRVPGLSSTAGHVRQVMEDKRITCRAYTREHGEDAPEIRDWTWVGQGD